MSYSTEDVLESFAESTSFRSHKREWFGTDSGFRTIVRMGRKRIASDLRAEGNRRRAARRYRIVMASPELKSRYDARRRAWWRRTHPLPACVECGRPTRTGHAHRCVDCLPAWKRKLAAARQRRFKARRAR